MSVDGSRNQNFLPLDWFSLRLKVQEPSKSKGDQSYTAVRNGTMLGLVPASHKKNQPAKDPNR